MPRDPYESLFSGSDIKGRNPRDPYGNIFPTDDWGRKGATPREPLPAMVNRGAPAPYQPTVPENTTADPAQDDPIKKLLGGAGGADLLGLISALLSLGQKKTPATVSTATTDPALQEAINIMTGRLNKSEPLFDSAMAMTNGLLPTAYQRPNPALGGSQTKEATLPGAWNGVGGNRDGRADDGVGKRR